MRCYFSVFGIRLASWYAWFALCSAILAGALELGAEELDASPDVQIEVVRQMQDFSQRSVAYISAQEEFLQFSAILEAALKEGELEATFKIRRFPGKFDSTLPRITVYLHEWGSHRDGQVRVVMGARSRWNDQVVDFGTFSGRTSLPITTVRSLRDRGYHDAMRKACEGFVVKLKEHLLFEEGVWRIKDADRE